MLKVTFHVNSINSIFYGPPSVLIVYAYSVAEAKRIAFDDVIKLDTSLTLMDVEEVVDDG